MSPQRPPDLRLRRRPKAHNSRPAASEERGSAQLQGCPVPSCRSATRREENCCNRDRKRVRRARVHKHLPSCRPSGGRLRRSTAQALRGFAPKNPRDEQPCAVYGPEARDVIDPDTLISNNLVPRLSPLGSVSDDANNTSRRSCHWHRLWRQLSRDLRFPHPKGPRARRRTVCQHTLRPLILDRTGPAAIEPTDGPASLASSRVARDPWRLLEHGGLKRRRWDEWLWGHRWRKQRNRV